MVLDCACFFPSVAHSVSFGNSPGWGCSSEIACAQGTHFWCFSLCGQIKIVLHLDGSVLIICPALSCRSAPLGARPADCEQLKFFRRLACAVHESLLIIFLRFCFSICQGFFRLILVSSLLGAAVFGPGSGADVLAPDPSATSLAASMFSPAC